MKHSRKFQQKVWDLHQHLKLGLVKGELMSIENTCRVCGETMYGGGAYGACDKCTKKAVNKAVKERKYMSNEKLRKEVGICLNHKSVDGMAERITKVYPNVTHVKIKGVDCVACNNKV